MGQVLLIIAAKVPVRKTKSVSFMQWTQLVSSQIGALLVAEMLHFLSEENASTQPSSRPM